MCYFTLKIMYEKNIDEKPWPNQKLIHILNKYCEQYLSLGVKHLGEHRRRETQVPKKAMNKVVRLRSNLKTGKRSSAHGYITGERMHITRTTMTKQAHSNFVIRDFTFTSSL